jgi:hypothetical protein
MVLIVVLIVPLVVLPAWTWITLHVAYSNGERVGYVQKISRKGWVCKTWEGELAMVSMPGTAPQIFYFTVPSDAMARKVMDAAGQRVALIYEQHRGVPSKCFGETEYFISGVRVVGP